MKKIIPYLLINIVVSAFTMLAVILIWNAFHPAPVVKNYPNLTTAGTAEAVQATLPPLDRKSVVIQSVFLPGEMDYERITLKNESENPVDLTGWRLVNHNGERFVFPSLVLYPNGAVDVHTKAGVNTAVELFANHAESMWKSGAEALLQDSAGQERSRYQIP